MQLLKTTPCREFSSGYSYASMSNPNPSMGQHQPFPTWLFPSLLRRCTPVPLGLSFCLAPALSLPARGPLHSLQSQLRHISLVRAPLPPLTSHGMNHMVWSYSCICLPHQVQGKTQMMNWLSLSCQSCNYGEHSFLQRQSSVVNENLGFRVKTPSIQGDFNGDDSPCFGFLLRKMGRNGLNTNL